MEKVTGERLMTLTELSEMLGVPIHTLYGWRHRGEGPVGYRRIVARPPTRPDPARSMGSRVDQDPPRP